MIFRKHTSSFRTRRSTNGDFRTESFDSSSDESASLVEHVGDDSRVRLGTESSPEEEGELVAEAGGEGESERERRCSTVSRGPSAVDARTGLMYKVVVII